MTEGAPAANADATGGDGEAPTGVPADVPAKTPKPKPEPKPAPESTPGSEAGTGGRVRRERKQVGQPAHSRALASLATLRPAS